MARKSNPACETEKEIFPCRLKQLMDETQTSQQTLGDAINVTRQAISNYISGQSSPDWKKLALIANYFKVSSDWLVGASDIKTPDMNVQAICSYTGLLEESVKALNAITNSAKADNISEKCIAEVMNSVLAIINYLFMSKEFTCDLMWNIINFADCHYKFKENRIIPEGSEELNDGFINLLSENRELKNKMDGALWNAERTFSKIICDMVEAFYSQEASHGEHSQD